MKTLVIVSHSYPGQSRVNKELLDAVKDLPNVTVREPESLYGRDGSKIDVKAEQQAIEAADRIVFQFPMFWFSVPGMLKNFMDDVLTYGWAYGSKGKALVGKIVQVAVSTGSPASSYEIPTVRSLFLPLEASACYTGMKYAEPFVTYGTLGMSDEALKERAAAYRRLLAE